MKKEKTSLLGTKEKMQNKLEIRKRVEHLKGTDIWITEDYTKKMQQERKQLIAHLKQAKQKGYKAVLEHNKLITY
jgi:oligoribonuclease NrnB/cAMP/cGMP phosphodiesterase (DHH superfamily)